MLSSQRKLNNENLVERMNQMKNRLKDDQFNSQNLYLITQKKDDGPSDYQYDEDEIFKNIIANLSILYYCGNRSKPNSGEVLLIEKL